jgi:hypothetical protein
LIEEHATLLNYEIPRSSIQHLSQAFRILEQNKARLQIDDYCLSQSTLEQVSYSLLSLPSFLPGSWIYYIHLIGILETNPP